METRPRSRKRLSERIPECLSDFALLVVGDPPSLAACFRSIRGRVSGTEWDVCKSPGFPSNRVAAGQVDPPAVRIAMVCSLFACRLSASEAFLFLSGALCWVFSNAYTKEDHLLEFFRGLWSEKGRRYSTQKATRRLRHSAEALVEEAKVKVFRPPQPTCLPQDLDLSARKAFHQLCGASCSQKSAKSTAQVSYGQLRKGFVKIVAGCCSILKTWLDNNRVLRLPAIVLLNTTFRPGNSGLLRVYVQAF